MISTSSSSSSISSLSLIWQRKSLRRNILSRLDTSSLRALRLTALEYIEITTPYLFKQARLVFTARSLTRPARLNALSRIGHLIENLTFEIPHSNKNFLPPLINPETKQEVNFLYIPCNNVISSTQRSKYASQELEDILIQQYPPIFHAATNVPAFINVMSMMSNLHSISILCQGKYLGHKYRRSTTEYVLISLRIALERAPLLRLKKLSLFHISPEGIRNLRHTLGYGCTPSSGRRWKQIEELEIVMDSWDFHGDRSSNDYARILGDFIRGLSPNLEKMSFSWSGQKGPCPFFIYKSLQLAHFGAKPKLFGETTTSMSPLPALPSHPCLSFPRLKFIQLKNTMMTKLEVADLILRHHKTIREFQFYRVILIDGSSWEEALMPLNLVDERDEWQLCQSRKNSDSKASFYSKLPLPKSKAMVDEVVETINPILDKTIANKISSSVVVKGEPTHRKRRRKIDRKAKDELFKSEKTKNSASLQFNDSRAPLDPKIQGVQRNIQIENAQLELSFDSKKRISTLKKAKQAVLKQLGREFFRESKNAKCSQEVLNDNYLNSRGEMKYLGRESLSALVPLMLSR